MNIENLNELIKFCENKTNNSFLFAYRFNELDVRGIFFANSKSMLIGIENYNCAWNLSIKTNRENLNYINTYIPNDIYIRISKSLRNDENYTNEQFFSALIDNLLQIVTQECIEGADDCEILALLANARFSTERYGRNDVERPFFHYWRRVRPSVQSLDKIEDVFGNEVRQKCYRENITAVWSTNPTENSLEFLTRNAGDEFSFRE
ncbi:hypothetical protein MOVS_02970 [Moraxella ovis]|uniref:Uncharacterized protein n=1 Tax=Moraxella ovis TaxID=29433 RepID=A0A378PJR1_9GAMM|nr:hypothetical protein [Moraxella ovis]ANB91119.1 hypothetical protein MOVS_02970 [Moraxella ovis]STY86636.1 Uncharacterised protein [Moraxella ovis]